MSAENTSKLKKHMFHLVVITIAGAMIYGLPYFRSYFYDAYLETYNLTNTQMGTFGSMFGIFGMISYLFGGVVADMVSTRKLMSVSLVLTGLGGLLHLLNPSYIMLLGIYALWGFTSLFAFWPSLLKSLREIANDNEQSKAYGFMDGGRGIVYAIDGVAIVSIFGYFSKVSSDLAGLNGVITYYSIVAIVLGVLLFILMKDSKPSAETLESAPKQEKISVAQVLEVIKMPAVWILSSILCCTYVMNIAFYYFTPYATSNFGMAATAGAIVTIAAQYVRPVASFGGGIIADKLGRSKVMYVTFAMMAIGTFLMVIMNNMSSTLFIALCIMIYAGMYGGYSLVFSMMEEGGVPIRVAGTAIGLVCTVGYLPEVIVPFCSGKILDTFGDGGYRYMFIAIAIIMVVGIVMLTVWDRYVKKVKARQAAEENAAA
ncbi:MAG: MFS transporter [Emergencia timonensis]|uniref:MFS transporter n=1 Tax=Emergencia timonensis TaxID=1776384 RepID=UPI00082F8CF7|nr:MFS transporter [Emergencia timonensis]WNX90167.1 MFS transporter [Emergencia timonensis]